MAKKKAARKTSHKKVGRHTSKKPTMAKKSSRKTAKAKAPKTASQGKGAKNRLSAKPARKVAALKAAPRQKAVIKSTQPAIQNRPSPRPAQPVLKIIEPAAAVSPPPAAPLKTADVGSELAEARPTGLLPGQRVRHRYEHWWGTVVQKLDDVASIGNVPAPIRYIVTVDGGMLRDDIRPEDLTVT